ncbi:MAG: hypothetical protein KAU95_04340, partial [Candidatus Aenigmarchaeota archaeon]|nr:hypothetical protein [Candidatus Aenigmarchaeota archaeon]
SFSKKMNEPSSQKIKRGKVKVAGSNPARSALIFIYQNFLIHLCNSIPRIYLPPKNNKQICL